MQTPTPPRNLTEIVREFEDDVLPGELMDILKAVQTLKRGSGWGVINLVYLNMEVDTIEITIKRKPKKNRST